MSEATHVEIIERAAVALMAATLGLGADADVEGCWFSLTERERETHRAGAEAAVTAYKCAVVNPVRLNRADVYSVLRGLMLSENFGDVHDEINRLHELIGLPAPKGDGLDGWSKQSWERLGVAADEDDPDDADLD